MSSALTNAKSQLGRRYRQCRDIVAAEGFAGLRVRARSTASRWLQPAEPILEVRREDVLAVDLSSAKRPRVPPLLPGQAPSLNWVMVPPTIGSGGHTTIFRVINYLQAHGYDNRVYFYDPYRADHEYYRTIVRKYYNFSGVVESVESGMRDAHGIVATSWNTAYPVFAAAAQGKRFYLVQDFEPYFYPVGSLSLLAENTYRMGFHGIAIGTSFFVARLRNEYGMSVESFDFGVDTARYFLKPNVQRNGVVFYARPNTPRRGFELGLMALEVFSRKRPDIEVHTYGDKLGSLGFRFNDHGRVSPQQLNDIYNSCFAGLSLSFTNLSLVPFEMLAAGCIPVVNDADHSRADMNSLFVRYARPDPHALAGALEAVVSTNDFEALSVAAARSVKAGSWDEAGARVDEIVRRQLSIAANPTLVGRACD